MSASSERSRVFITGSADGLGRAAAQTLLAQEHEVAWSTLATGAGLRPYETC